MSLSTESKLDEVFKTPNTADEIKATDHANKANPFIPKTNPNYVLNRAFAREVVAFLQFPNGDSLFVTGPTGSGKTSCVTEIAARMKWPVQHFTVHGNMELSDLIGQYKLATSQPGEAPSMQFIYGPLAIAMREGHIFLIDEFDVANSAEIPGSPFIQRFSSLIKLNFLWQGESHFYRYFRY